MAYENLVLGVSPITKTVFGGRLNKAGNMWVDKKDVTQDFLRVCLDYFEPDTENTISVEGKGEIIITVRRAIEPIEKKSKYLKNILWDKLKESGLRVVQYYDDKNVELKEIMKTYEKLG